MKKTAFWRIFALLLALTLGFSVIGVVSFADEGKIYVSLGGTVLYSGSAPDAESFTTVYYKNGAGLGGSEGDYNAKLEYSAEDGFVLTLDGLNLANAQGEYSIYSATNLKIVVLSDSKITHTVNTNEKNRYAIYVSGLLSVSGEAEIEVYLRGDCDFGSLKSHLYRATEIVGGEKLLERDGRSEQEKQIDNLKADFDNAINKTNYELLLAKLNFTNTTEAMKQETVTVKTIAIVAVVIGSVSLVVNIGFGVYLAVKRKAKTEDFEEDDE